MLRVSKLPGWTPILITVVMSLGVVLMWRHTIQQQSNTIKQLIHAETLRTADELTSWIEVCERAALRMARRTEQHHIDDIENWQNDHDALLEAFPAIRCVCLIAPNGESLFAASHDPDQAFASTAPWVQLRHQMIERSESDPKTLLFRQPLQILDGDESAISNLLIWAPLRHDNRYSGALEIVLNIKQLMLEPLLDEHDLGYNVQVIKDNQVIWSLVEADSAASEFANTTPIPLPRLPWSIRMWPTRQRLTQLAGIHDQTVLVPGLMTAVMVGLVTWLAIIARRRARELNTLNGRLESELAERHRIAEEQNRLVSILEATSDYVSTGAPDGRIFYLNSAGRRMVGLGLDQDLDDVCWHNLCPEWSAKTMLEVAIPQAIERGVWSGETALINPLGYEIPVSQVVVAHTDDQGKLKYLSTIIRDISDRKLTEEVLRESRQTLTSRLTAIEAAGDMIVITDPDGVIEYVNPAFTRITGYSLREAMGRKTSILKSGRHDAAYYNRIWKTIRAGRSWRGRIINRRKNGRLYHEEMTITPVKNGDGKIDRYVAIKRDMTRRRQAERTARDRQALQQAVSAMEQVLGVVGHELRTPLAALRATAEFLLTDADTLSQQNLSFMKAIHDQTIAMSEMVNNLLEAARLNSGCARWNWEHVNLQQACDSAMSVVNNLIDTERVTMNCHVEPDDLQINGDAEAIRRLVINLLTNAAKHTHDGTIEVSINRCVKNDHAWVQMRVRDTGEGIDDQVVDKLGQAFALNRGVVGSDYVKGTGLGLAICRGIVAAHGGSISVDSTVGEGTCFTVMMRADLAGPNDSAGDQQKAIRKEHAA